MASPVHDIIALLAALGLADSTRNVLLPAPMKVSAKTGNYTISPAPSIDPCGTLFTNRGAAGPITLTLPAPTAVPQGTWYHVLGIADQNIIIATPTADTLVTLNDVAADSIATQTSSAKIGALTKLVCDGTQWIALGETVGVTYTVVTA